MLSYSARVRATIEDRRRKVFRGWLAALPADGWVSTAGDLGAELAGFLAAHPHRFGTFFPTGAGLSKWLATAADEIAAAGRRLGFSRTKTERLITIDPCR